MLCFQGLLRVSKMFTFPNIFAFPKYFTSLKLAFLLCSSVDDEVLVSTGSRENGEGLAVFRGREAPAYIPWPFHVHSLWLSLPRTSNGILITLSHDLRVSMQDVCLVPLLFL